MNWRPIQGAAGRREEGASIVEYAILVAMIAIVALLAVQFFGGRVSNSFSRSASHVEYAR